MKWVKKGLIFKPKGDLEWAQTHAQVVTVQNMDNKFLRVIYSSRDSMGRSLPSYLDLDIDNPNKILYVHDKPILELGNIGSFDDCGIMPTWQLTRPDGYYLYYIGWNIRNTIPYHNAIGLAYSKDGKNYEKIYNGPIIHRTALEPFFNGNASVIFENNIYKMWYLSCTNWITKNGKAEPRYHIKYATSKDNLNWERNGIICIDYQSNNEGGISRPSIIHEKDVYRMWYSYRGITQYRDGENISNSYRIGYAESKDGINWMRIDQSPIYSLSISNDLDSWDGYMVEYPFVIDVMGKRLMFYNGNGFGASGFGYAELKN